MRSAGPVALNADDDRHLQILSNRKRLKTCVQLRARIVLLAAAGMSDTDNAANSSLIAVLPRVDARAFSLRA